MIIKVLCDPQIARAAAGLVDAMIGDGSLRCKDVDECTRREESLARALQGAFEDWAESFAEPDDHG